MKRLSEVLAQVVVIKNRTSQIQKITLNMVSIRDKLYFLKIRKVQQIFVIVFKIIFLFDIPSVFVSG